MTRCPDQATFLQMAEDFLDDFDGGDREALFRDVLARDQNSAEEGQAILRFLHSTKAGFRLLLAAAPEHPAAEIFRKGEILAHHLESGYHSFVTAERGDRPGRGRRLDEGLTALRRLVEEVRRLASGVSFREPDPSEEIPLRNAETPFPLLHEGRVAALLVRVSGVPCLFPLENVEMVARVEPSFRGGVLFRGEVLAFFPARQIWKFPCDGDASGEKTNASVVVRSAGGRAVLGVDRWERRGEFATRPVPTGFRFGGVRSVALLEGGEVALVLEMPERWP